MHFKSFYPRVIFILSTMALALFAILLPVNAYFFRVAVDGLMGELQKERMNHLFAGLDQRFKNTYSQEEVSAFLDSVYFEYNVDVFDRTERWLGGNFLRTRKVESATLLRKDTRFNGFSEIYYNPNPSSSFSAVKIDLELTDLPVIKKMSSIILVSAVFSVAVSIMVGWKLVSYLNMRLERLKSGVLEVSRGNFDVQLDDHGEDEIAFLAKSFNSMSGKIKRLIANLEESNAARQRLFAHASHEIKSPLTSIKGFVDIVDFMNSLPDEQQKHLLPAVRKDINRVIKITNDMLQLARLQNPQYLLECKKIDLLELIREEHSFFAQKAASQDARTFFESAISPPVEINTDPDRLSQILDNLWSNSLKYGDRRQPIRTKLFLKDGAACLTITNSLRTKLNVPAERLFEPFYRNPIDADKITGSGLGLTIVKELTEKLDGKIEAKLNANTIEITLRLPV